MDSLPIDESLPEIIAQLRAAHSVVVVAPPGAGKTTRVPPAILRAGLLTREHSNLILLQPRRIAARALAGRIAAEQQWTLGQEIGYQIRFEKRIGPQTRLRVLTEGILTRQLLHDAFLEGVGCVILDEFHERSLHSDLALAFLREIQQTVRNDLLLVVMSATLEAEPVARFLGGAPVVRTVGRQYPVDISHRSGGDLPLVERVVAAIADTVARPDGGGGGGDVLVFLPGAPEIHRVQDRLRDLAGREDLLVLPLHGSLTVEEQTRALAPARQRKIVLATNIAETSLTINGVTHVIDSGLARIAGYDPQRGLDRLELGRISRASATQRAGRAGRTAPGFCTRLWSVAEDHGLAEYELPEVRRVDLAATVLALHAWGATDPRQFGWYEPPEPATLAAAERLLAMLGALTAAEGGQITPIGRELLALPVHPRLGRLLLAATAQGRLEQGAAIAALLEEKDLLLTQRGPGEQHAGKSQGESDLLVRLEMLDRAQREGFGAHLRQDRIDPFAARQVARARDELIRVARGIRRAVAPSSAADPAAAADTDRALFRLPLWAYPDRVVRRRPNDPAAGIMVGGGGVRLDGASVVWQPEFYVALDARHDQRSKSREAVVRIAGGINLEDLQAMFPAALRQEKAVEFDAARGKPVTVESLYYYDLLLRQTRHGGVDPALAGAALAAQVQQQARSIIEGDPAALGVLARLDLLRQHMPEKPWPVLDDAQLGDLLAGLCPGKRSIAEIQQAPLAALLKTLLPYPLDRLLDEHAPETIAVPSGSRIRITYGAGAAPVLAVRLQELFGWTDTPRIAGGRVGLVLHLLGPNFRPVQITNDLRSFWSKAYFEVRKDLRIRYPRHSWPEDPLHAKPEAKGRRKS